MRRFSKLTAVALCFAVLITFRAFAQDRNSGAIAGYIEDEQRNPLSGTKITISSAALIGGYRDVASDRQGRFRFSGLPAGAYQMTAVLAGYKTVVLQKILVSVGMTAEVPVRMTLFAGEEQITVSDDSRIIDPTSSSMSTILPHEFLTNIPTDRETSHILDLAPGINQESAYGGAEESGISYQMDGVDISDPQDGEPWAFFNYSLIDQVELVGLGAPAEYGQFTGVVFNTVTKSGGNDLHGQTEFFYTDSGLAASTRGAGDLVSTIESHSEEAFQVGGPVRKDRLWIFGAAQYIRDLSSQGGPIETEKDPRLFLKLSYLANQKNTLDGWMQWAHTKIIGRNADAFTPLIATTGENNPEVVGNFSWKSALSENSMLNISWGGYNGHHHFDPHDGFSIPGHVDAQTGIASVNAAQFGIVDRNRNQINVSISQHVQNLVHGYHDLKFGAEIERSFVRDRFGYPGNAFFSDNEGPERDPSTGKDDFFTLAFYGGGYDARGTNHRDSLYAQDSWRITDSFTMNPGLRLDINRGSVANQNVFKTTPLAPRIGAAWDLQRDGRSILRAHYGRYYEALYASYYYYLQPGAFSPLTVQRVFNTSGFTQTLSSNPGQQYDIDPHIKQPCMDQYIVGFDRQLPLDIVFSGTFVSRKNQDFIETVSRDGIFAPVNGVVPETGQLLTLFDYLNSGSDVLIYTNPAGLFRSYRGIILSVERRMNQNWALQLSYVYSRSRGNIDNLGFDETGLGANTPFFEGHFLDTPNSLANARGRLTHDQTHQMKLQGTYNFSRNFSASANYTYYSGDTWTPRSDCLLVDGDCHDFPQGPFLYFAEPRGNRRLPAASELDLHAEWQHRFNNQGTLGLLVDIFNLNNQRRATEVETTVDEEFGQPATLNFPRNIRLGVKYSW
jgi:TonB dependent receptor/Carboxypeptidase regulatory-like domain